MDRAILNSLITRALPMGAQMLVISGAAIVMLSLVNGYGVPTAAAYGASSVLWNYLQMPAMAVGMAVSAMAAQNVGAKRWDRVEKMAFEALKLSVAATAIPVLVIHALHRPILGLLLPAGSPSIEIALDINNHVMWSYVIFATTFAFTSIVRATGAVVPPLVILGVTMWLVRVPVAAWASRYYGPAAIWWSFPVSAFCSATLSYLYYRFGGWRRARLIESPATP